MGLKRLVLLSFLLTTWTTLNAQQNRLRNAIDNRQLAPVRGYVHPHARGANDQGAVAGSVQLSAITLLLKPSATQQADLQQLLAQQRTPGSATFHRWLTPEQYADRFGVTADDMDKVVSWLKSQGFTVNQVARSRTFVTFSGTAAQVGSALHTEIHNYRVNGRTHFANATAPELPAALADITAGFIGLHNFTLQPRFKEAAAPQMTLSSGSHRLAPDDIATIYNIAPLYAAGIDGTGQKIAVVGQTAIDQSDIDKFRANFNLPATNLVQTLVPGSKNPGKNSDDLPEADLDIEWAGAIARNATIVYVYSTDVMQSLSYAIDNNVAPVISMSYGACEPQDIIDLPSYQQMALQANAQGQTWLAASGDAGAADCEDLDANVAQNGLAVDMPAAIPEVTGLGGTVFAEAGNSSYWASVEGPNHGSAQQYIPEQAWNDTSLGGGFASTGGGASVFFSRPPWQTGAGLPNDAFRHVPDVSLSASANHDGYYVYSSGAAHYYGGTSVAAPSMAGIVALLNHYLVTNNLTSQAGLGNINPGLYRLAQTNPEVFHDVIGGSNSVPCAAGSPDCGTDGLVGLKAGVGYDSTTGLGSLDAYAFVHAWGSNPAKNSAVAASLDQSPIFQQSPDSAGNKWRFTLTLTEEAGIATTLTDLNIDGVSYASQISSLFGGTQLGAGKALSAKIGLSSVAVPKTVIIRYGGVDANGQQWSNQIAVPFQPAQVHLTIAGISNAASGQQVFAPGMILSVYGTSLGNFAQSAATLPLPQYLAGFEAWVNNVPAPLYYVSPNQVNVQIPYETKAGNATLTLGNPFENVDFRFRVASAGPGVFTFADGSLNPSKSAARGQVATLYMTGDGAVTPSLATGSAPSPGTPTNRLPHPQAAVTVTVGNVPATVDFIGIPTWGVGITQLNFRIPDTVPAGVQPVVVTVGGVASNVANITVQ